MQAVHIGSSTEFIEIRLPESYSSEGWAQAEVKLCLRRFRGDIQPWVEAADFERFERELSALYQSLQGEANFEPLDQQFVLRLVGAAGGHIQVTGKAWSEATYGDMLSFSLDIDQSYLQAPIQELQAILALGIRS